ncbi:MAG: Ribosomal large subunit pseudouridine synthase B [uncultured Rubrobacteraceae bacterium]|uniref:Pseudouridine synthase n=1 Tax=uncultured Rubrobacteraceae bacterium TaxID=349277 RepID=A0A6J4QYM1_9ACTN|nr:MAG: Ribosomal large subunit pseudouridine synthase B [uncultured Rubrobacteraceae bacterium]
MRLQAFLARSGAAPSRRKAEILISAGRVLVNGDTANLGESVALTDDILLDGEPVSLPETHAYLALNKPAGYLTTLKDDRNRRTVADLMPENVPGLVPIGRLDVGTTGLLLLTNDGPLAHHIAHPSSEIEKEYELILKTPEADLEERLAALAQGPQLEDGKMLPPRLQNLRQTPKRLTLNLTIHEGRNRIIRRACAAIGLVLLSLKRVRVGPVSLGSLPEGRYRKLTEQEINIFEKSMGRRTNG